MATELEIIVGTYEEFLLGYRVRPSRSNDRKYDLFQTFSTHSHTSSIRTVATNGKLVASGGADDRICVYDLEKRRAIDDLYVHDGTINSLTFVPDGSYLISGGADGKMTFVKTNNWKVDKVFERAHKGSSVNFISVHPSGKLALSIGSDLTLRTWNLINGRQAFVTSLKNKSLGSIIDFVVWSISGDYFVLTGKDSVEIWCTEKAEVIATKKCEARPSSVCWISDSDILVGMENGKLLFFNWEDENEEATICEIYETRIKAMKYVNGFLATASTSGELNLWKVINGEKIEMEMICGIDVGCRLLCLDICELVKSGIDPEIKDEVVEDESKTQVRQLTTSGCVTVEIEENDDSDDGSKRNKQIKRKNKQTKFETPQKNKQNKKQRKSAGVRLSNGFVEEDC
ncbi:CLUMA_CG016376, isoform A [Clunio marinus]|uniref:CLUMA_CG016376, isoform A n=1 Tax=Clunio marinus TaxID=568069 RepID=A0A1J1IS13_9DIPT|nr:CLUMA_CG016376, isoform A [Clunio marinus]